MWKLNSCRLRIITNVFLIIYTVILLTAFYYQIIGDKGIMIYERQENYLELVLIETIRTNTAALSIQLLSLAAGFYILLSLIKFMKHVLVSNKAREYPAMDRNIEATILFGLLIFLCISGAIMVYSSTFALALSRGLNGSFFLNRHLLGILIGLCLFLVIQKTDYAQLKRSVPFLVVLGMLSLLLVFHPTLGVRYGGFSRWCHLGSVTIQPSEFSRFILLGTFAYYHYKNGASAKPDSGNFLKLVLVWGAMGFLILLEPNYGCFVELGILFLILLFVSEFPLIPFFGVVGVFICTILFFLFTSHYRIVRFLAFLEPHYYYKTSGYQIVQSLVSFSSGGFLGSGIGAGKQKLFYLPEMYNDYIFAVIGEELGLLGVFLVATAYLGLFFLCIRISRRAPDLFGALFSFGAGVFLTLGAFINMSVCLKLVPPTGLVLPFISYGGSSMVASIVTIGVVQRIGFEGRHS